MLLSPEESLYQIQSVLSAARRTDNTVSGEYRDRQVVIRIEREQNNATAATTDGGLLESAIAGVAELMFHSAWKAITPESKKHSLTISVACNSALIFDLNNMDLGTEKFQFEDFKKYLTADRNVLPVCRVWLHSPEVIAKIAALIREQQLRALQKNKVNLTMLTELQTEYSGIDKSLDDLWQLAETLEKL